MADDEIVKPEGEEEYHFSEGVQSDVFAASKTKKSRFNITKINKRSVLIVIGAIIVIFAIYKLVSIFLESRSKTTQQTQPQQQLVQQQPQQQAQPEPQPQSQNVQLPSEVTQQIQQIQQHSQAGQAKVSELENQIETLSDAINNLQSSLNSMSTQLQQIVTKLNSQQAIVASMKKRPVVHRTYTKRRKFTPKPVQRATYYIHAMIPNRAWLMTPDGSTTVTVTIGSRLQGYGRVTAIDPVNGKVITSSGAIIRYRYI